MLDMKTDGLPLGEVRGEVRGLEGKDASWISIDGCRELGPRWVASLAHGTTRHYTALHLQRLHRRVCLGSRW